MVICLLSDKIIKIGDFIYRVYEYTDNMELEIGNAYLIGGLSVRGPFNNPVGLKCSKSTPKTLITASTSAFALLALKRHNS